MASVLYGCDPAMFCLTSWPAFYPLAAAAHAGCQVQRWRGAGCAGRAAPAPRHQPGAAAGPCRQAGAGRRRRGPAVICRRLGRGQRWVAAGLGGDLPGAVCLCCDECIPAALCLASALMQRPPFHSSSTLMLPLPRPQVWASKWNERAWLSRRAQGVPDEGGWGGWERG